MMLPWFIGFKFRAPKFSLPTLWLPVFLLWPLLFILSLPIFLIACLVALVSNKLSMKGLWGAMVGGYRLLCALRGTKVDVEGQGARIFVSIV